MRSQISNRAKFQQVMWVNGQFNVLPSLPLRKWLYVLDRTLRANKKTIKLRGLSPPLVGEASANFC
jgi:hypothetical protein